MKQDFLSSILASIEAERDAMRCESALTRFFPVAEFVTFIEHHYPDGKVGIRPHITLRRVKDNVPIELEAYVVLKPQDNESFDHYLDRLANHLEYLDDHALFVEVKSEMFS